MNAVKGRLLAISVTVGLVGTERLLEAAGLEYAWEVHARFPPLVAHNAQGMATSNGIASIAARLIQWPNPEKASAWTSPWKSLS